MLPRGSRASQRQSNLQKHVYNPPPAFKRAAAASAHGGKHDDWVTGPLTIATSTADKVQ
jgi:hypothetical protein